eukprot:117180-Pelagomonas_calceolata.AAC.1
MGYNCDCRKLPAAMLTQLSLSEERSEGREAQKGEILTNQHNKRSAMKTPKAMQDSILSPLLCMNEPCRRGPWGKFL